MIYKFHRDMPSVLSFHVLSFIGKWDCYGDTYWWIQWNTMPVVNQPVPLGSGLHPFWTHCVRKLVSLDKAIDCSYPRLFYLTDSTSPDTFDSDSSNFNSIAIGLNSTYSTVFNMMQYHWVIYSDNAYTPKQFEKGVSFWVINETVLSRTLRVCSFHCRIVGE